MLLVLSWNAYPCKEHLKLPKGCSVLSWNAYHCQVKVRFYITRIYAVIQCVYMPIHMHLTVIKITVANTIKNIAPAVY